MKRPSFRSRADPNSMAAFRLGPKGNFYNCNRGVGCEGRHECPQLTAEEFHI